jgi:hypothetical protein
MPRPYFLLLFPLIAPFSCPRATAQTGPVNSNDTIRVTVRVNADGSRTTYQYNNAKHEAVATTTDSDGNALSKVVYRIDDAGRFGSGVTFGPDGKFLFKSIYKYDAGGRLEEESRLARDDSVINKIVYQYDPAGKQVGYSIFDGTGKLISGTSSPAPGPTSKAHKPLGR